MENSAPVNPTAPVTPETPGTPLTPATAEPTTATPPDDSPKSSSSKLPLVLMGIGLLAVVIIAVIYFVTMGKSKNISYTNTTTTAVVPTIPVATTTPIVNDTSNAGLQQDNQTLTQDMTNLDTLEAQVNSAMADQAPNLQ